MKASKSGFYKHLGRKKPNAQIRRETLEGFVVEAFERHKGRYGYRRINREPRKSGIAMSEKRVLRIMRKLGLAGRGATRKHRIQKKVEPGDPRLNLAERAFAAASATGFGRATSHACPREKGGSISQPRQAPSPARSWAGRCPGASPRRSRSTR